MMNQRYETLSDASKNDMNPKIGSGFKRKRLRDIRFNPKKGMVLVLQNVLLLTEMVVQKINMFLLGAKVKLKQT